MENFGRPPIPECDRKSTMGFRVKPHVRASVEAMAKRENVSASAILERFVLQGLGLDQDAVSLWMAENRQRAAVDAERSIREAFREQG